LPRVNPGYATFQLAKALATSEGHEDTDTRRRAAEKVSKWETVLRNVLTGSVAYGARTPVQDAPAWVTLEVVTGGFATGNFLAGGPLESHEVALLEGIAKPPEGQERAALNAHFLTEPGLAVLREQLVSGTYDVTVPEEGALLTVAWLVEHGHHEGARALLDELLPHFSRLRFYPVPLERPRRRGQHVHVQTVGDSVSDLRRIAPNRRLKAQKEAVEVWAPFHDRVVSMFSETVVDGWPCQSYASGWNQRALALVAEYSALRKEHSLCSKPDRPGGHQRRLRALLDRCARDPGELSGRDVGMIRRILNCYVDKRGAPGSTQCSEARKRQASDVSAPTFHAIAQLVIPRLQLHPRDEPVDDVAHLTVAVTAEEARADVPEGTSIPPSICRKVERCLSDTIDALVGSGLIRSGDTLARVLPQVTSGIRPAAIRDPQLRQLYSAVYRAFRKRRSLLLLDLEKQVQIEDLPWIAVIDWFRFSSLSDRDLARATLCEISLLALTSFPHAVLPNKLLQELGALSKTAHIELPLVDELAADIFMGTFTGKFTAALRQAAELLDGSLYATYYGIDYPAAVAATSTDEPKPSGWFRRRRAAGEGDALARLCASRAGVKLGTWHPASNGMVIEQQQILTTQNLAVVVAGLGLTNELRPHLDDMAKRCFSWICKRLQVQSNDWHAKLITVKNTAYAWRQMLFYLALQPTDAVREFVAWADSHLGEQRQPFQSRFRPALAGLVLAVDGQVPDREPDQARQFLGWCDDTHWLLRDRDSGKNS